jgi:hypothetical protein
MRYSTSLDEFPTFSFFRKTVLVHATFTPVLYMYNEPPLPDTNLTYNIALYIVCYICSTPMRKYYILYPYGVYYSPLRKYCNLYSPSIGYNTFAPT